MAIRQSGADTVRTGQRSLSTLCGVPHSTSERGMSRDFWGSGGIRYSSRSECIVGHSDGGAGTFYGRIRNEESACVRNSWL